MRGGPDLATIPARRGPHGAVWAQEQSQIPTTGEKVAGAPVEVKRDWGTFKLADRIADKVKKGEKINYVFSYQASGIPLFSPQYGAGFEHGCKLGNAIYADGLRLDRAGADRPQPAGLADRGQARGGRRSTACRSSR